jgi:hypothetical protein
MRPATSAVTQEGDGAVPVPVDLVVVDEPGLLAVGTPPVVTVFVTLSHPSLLFRYDNIYTFRRYDTVSYVSSAETPGFNRGRKRVNTLQYLYY